ncbi:MAG: choice-of-anchor D domain-containing protein [Archangium sp.]
MKTVNAKWMSLLVAVAVVGGCRCDPGTRKLAPKIEVLDDMGNSRTSVDFGQVQLHFKAVKRVRIRNAGAATLTISKADFTKPLFTVDTMLPVQIAVNEEYLFPLAFTPDVADQRETGSVTLTTDDPNAQTVKLDLAGTGVTATAVVQPTTLDFGDVYVGEMKEIMLSLTNGGSNELPVTSATVMMAGADVTSDTSPIVKTLMGGETATIAVRFAPTSQQILMGSLEIVLPAGVGNQSIPIRGKGIQAQPKLCFKFDDSAMESCTDGTTTLDVRFGSLCDGRVYPSDAGLTCVLDGGAIAYERSGRMYVRNDGNTPVSYTLGITAGSTTRCADAGSSIDFAYANAPVAPDGGVLAQFMVPSFKLPMLASDPKPWETAPVAVTYRARSACRGDGADLSTILWTRQGEPLGTMRRPSSMIATLNGASLLSDPQPNTVTFTGNNPAPQDVTLVSNTGDGPVVLLQAELWQTTDGGPPNERCAVATGGPCQYFSWTTGPTLPVTLEGTTTPTVRITRVVGQLVYGTLDDAGMRQVPSLEQRVYAIVFTSDPYTPYVTIPITGRLQ